MRFHGLMLLRDEADVIGQCLDSLLEWIDDVYILDLGSTDGTWDIVQDYAKRDKRIIPFEHAPILYSDTLRSYIFHHVRDRFDAGDWVMRLDADEFYHITPPAFVEQRLRRSETAVYLQWYFFRLTQQEVADYESGKVDVMQDRQRPISERRRYYKISEYAEPRMFKYRRTMRWPETISFPYNAGFVARERIPIRHYPHRDPLQMQARFELRAAQMKLNALAGGHWKLDDWRKEVVGMDGSESSGGRGLADTPSVVAGPLYFWDHGSQFVEQAIPNSFSMHKKLLQQCVHRFGLPLLDARRAHFSHDYKPRAMPAAIDPIIQ
jgi:hypothetical protein